jgi:hypothetical protein
VACSIRRHLAAPVAGTERVVARPGPARRRVLRHLRRARLLPRDVVLERTQPAYWIEAGGLASPLPLSSITTPET